VVSLLASLLYTNSCNQSCISELVTRMSWILISQLDGTQIVGKHNLIEDSDESFSSSELHSSAVSTCTCHVYVLQLRSNSLYLCYSRVVFWVSLVICHVWYCKCGYHFEFLFSLFCFWRVLNVYVGNCFVKFRFAVLMQIPVKPGVTLRDALAKPLRLREINLEKCIVHHYMQK
jgi:Raf-like Ras-binding domain